RGVRRRACLLGLAFVLTRARSARGAAAPGTLPRLGPARNFALTTQQNDRLWLTQLRGRIVVLTFFCTTCQACPELFPFLLDLSRALGDTAGRRVFFVAVSVDPQRDTAPVLRRFARDRSAALTAWAFLTGKRSEVELVTQWYGVDVRRDAGGIAHACLAVLIDREGTIRGRYGAGESGRLREAMDALLTAGRGA
ncbi:MAG: SCO family protein, partial [Candidatus Rokuibacteriota bacterium]